MDNKKDQISRTMEEMSEEEKRKHSNSIESEMDIISNQLNDEEMDKFIKNEKFV